MFVLKNHCASQMSEADSQACLSHSKQLLRNIHPMMLFLCRCVGFSFFSTMPRDWLGRTSPKWPYFVSSGTYNLNSTVVTPKNLQNDQMYTHPSTKKKCAVTTFLYDTQLTFSHWWHQSASHKWTSLHQSDTCQSQIQGWWELFIITWCYNHSSCPP